MEYIQRSIEKQVAEELQAQKVSIILGARRVGKTELIKTIMSTTTEPFLALNGEDVNVHRKLEERSIANYKGILEGYNLLVIDEAQAIPEIGKKLKLMCDEIPGLKILATGSSAFDIMQRFGEPLTGRSKTYHLYPIAQMELTSRETSFETSQNLAERLIFGSYPELFHLSNSNQKAKYLIDVVGSYLIKDILIHEGLKRSSTLIDLLRLLAYQVGQLVSMQELGKQLGMSKNTVEKYMHLLSQTFVIYPLGGYSRNLRKEVVKNRKWYFYDNGIRNALIDDFRLLNERPDAGLLWENYLQAERMKFLDYSGQHCATYFWRTYDQQEIDRIEEAGGRLNAFEFKWSPNKVAKSPMAWKKAYPQATFEQVDQKNYLNFIR